MQSFACTGKIQLHIFAEEKPFLILTFTPLLYFLVKILIAFYTLKIIQNCIEIFQKLFSN